MEVGLNSEVVQGEKKGLAKHLHWCHMERKAGEQVQYQLQQRSRYCVRYWRRDICACAISRQKKDEYEYRQSFTRLPRALYFLEG